jgi:predicted ATPase
MDPSEPVDRDRVEDDAYRRVTDRPCGEATAGPPLVEQSAGRWHVPEHPTRPQGSERRVIRTPDQRLRVFVSSTLEELAPEREAAREAIERLRLTPVLFELGARPHPPRDLYRAYLEQSHIFVGIYGARYGWIAPGESVSGLEDELHLSGQRPKLVYVKRTAGPREPRLAELLRRIERAGAFCYRLFATADELRELIGNDLAVLLTERFEEWTAAGRDRLGEPAPTNLPIPRSALVGRERELRMACDLLRRGGAGLVTLTGPGGCGKSRLGLQIGLDLLGDFEGGVFLVTLETIRDPAMVLPAIAATLGVREVPGRFPLEVIGEQLGGAHVLLLLDNFEQLVEAAPDVSALLEHCPRLAVLVTSRTPLRVRGEYELPVPPLAAPAAFEAGPQSLSQYAAVALFMQRARAVRPGFAVTDANAPAIAEICHRLDGLPLAIELATARLKILSPEALLARLASRFDLLQGGTRDLPERHRTLRGAIDWSHDLLGDRERRLFRRLAVFAGGATFEAAEAVCRLDPEGEGDMLESIASLLDSSLLTGTFGDDGELRVFMLHTMRAYARERLEASGELEQIGRKHAEHYVALAEQAKPHLTGGDEPRWARRIRDERDNLREALDWSKTHDAASGLRLCVALWRYWEAHGGIVEAHGWLHTLLALATPPTVLRADALRADAGFSCYLGEYDSARTELEEAMAILEGLTDERRLAVVLNELGLLACHRGDYAEARRLLEQSLAIKRALGDDWLLANAAVNLGLLADYEGDHARALELHRESLELFRRRKDEMGVAIATGNLAHTAMHLGRLGEAHAGQIESLRLFSARGDADGSAECLERLSMLANAQDDCRRAARLLGCAAALREEAGTSPGAFERAELERALETARSRLGQATFDAERRAGQELSAAQAIELAAGMGSAASVADTF